MKKTIFIAFVLTLSFCAGWFTGEKANDVKFLHEANNFKRELIDAQNAALEKAEIIMDRHNLWDIDGSDDMADYLEFSMRVDSLWNTQL